MPGGNQEPYRAPCAGRPANLPASDCGSGRNPAHAAIPRFKNTTLVASFCARCGACNPGDPEIVVPYVRNICTTHSPPLEDCTEADCGPWENPGNTYAPPPEGEAQTVDLSVPCGIKKGFKVVFGKKVHHGRNGYYFERFPTSTNLDGSCHGHGGPRLTPDVVKFRRLNVDAGNHRRSYQYGPGTSGAEGLYSEDRVTLLSECEVARLSGRRTGQRTETFYSWFYNSGDPIISDAPSPEQLEALDDLIGEWETFNVGQSEAFFRTLVAGYSGTMSVTGGALIFTYNNTTGLATETVNASCDLQSGAVTFTRLTTNYEGEFLTQQNSDIRTLNISNTALAWEYRTLSENWSEAGLYTRDEFHQHYRSALAAPYYTSEVRDDVVAALAEWNLADDAQYPWRIDGTLARGPLVSYNERSSPNGPELWPRPIEDPENPGTFIPFVDDEPIGRTGIIWTNGTETVEYEEGGIIGIPLPTGYDAFFDFYHVGYRFELAGSGMSALENSSGELSPFPHATQWTDNAWGLNQEDHVHWLPTGPFSSYGTLINPEKYTTDGGPITLNTEVLWMAKWAEVIERNPSHNFFRPCGADRDAMKWDEPEVNRWPEAWPICGRVKISSATVDAGTVTVNLEVAADYLRTGDVVDILNYGGDHSESITDANKTVTVVSPTQFTYAGGSVPTGAYVKPHGAPHYRWHDTRSKGQYLYKVWSMNFRDFWESYFARLRFQGQGEDCSLEPNAAPVRYTPIPADAEAGSPEFIGDGAWWFDGFTQIEGCVGHRKCAPVGVMITPNGETRAGFNTYDMPDAGKVIDVKYGAFFIGRVDQITYDPLYNAEIPPTYCEAIATLPAGAPALPADAVPLGCEDFMANLEAGNPIWIACQPQYQFWLETVEGSFDYRTYAEPKPEIHITRWNTDL